MRSRKGKGGQRGEENAARADSKYMSDSAPTSAGLTVLWVFLLLVVAGCGIAGWYIQQQLHTIDSLDQTIQILQKRLSQVELIHSQMKELNEKLLVAEAHEQRLQDLEIAWAESKKRMEMTTEAVTQIQSANVNSKVAVLQSEMSKTLGELRKDFLTRNDLAQLENRVKVLQEVEFAQAEQQVASMKAATSKLEENVDLLSASLPTLTSRVASLEAERQDLQSLQQSIQDINVVKELMDHSLPSLSNGMIALRKQVNETTQVTDIIRSQLAQHSKELSALKDSASHQQAEHLSRKEELEHIRKMANQLQMEKISMEELENAIESLVTSNISELQRRTSNMDEMLATLQNHVTKVESDGANQNKELADALNQTSHTLQKTLGKIETNLKRTVEQCLSGEVRTFCETSENCAWPHIREVNFPHRILKDPVIMLSLAEISSVDSVGVTVKALDITDSGFKIQISSIGNYNLSTVRVNWLLCA
ncbi:mitochondrial proton/calcium exchanger protein-like [Mobula hypostoma]|uniref:mitochondrial proton/calcium exchanger protein-like n=1 Tax=Mobula hypostoma TaxID=723540 RepID=UPI002FC3709A